MGENKKKSVDGKTHSVSAKKNQAKYLKKFGVNFEIPQVVILGCKFFPRNPDYMLKLVKYNCPGPKKQEKTGLGE